MPTATTPQELDILSVVPACETITTPPKDTTSLDTGSTHVMGDLYRAAIGPVGTGFYQGHFDQFEAADRYRPTWNWSAALLTLNWMIFRRLWLAAIGYAGAVVAVLVGILGLGRLIFHWSSPVEWGLLALAAWCAFVVPGAFGNALFHVSCRKKMAAALAANTTVPEACAMLEKQASTKSRVVWIGMANALVLGAAVGIYVAIPDAERAHVANSSTGQSAEKIDATAAAAAEKASAIASATVPETPVMKADVALPAAASASASTPIQAPASSQSALAPSDTSSPAPQAAAIAPVAAPSQPLAAITPPQPERAPQATQAAQPEQPARTPAPQPKAEANKIFINVGLFAKESNARNALEKLAQAGLPSQAKTVTGTKGTFTRVRVGPYKTLAQAEKAAAKIKALGLDAVVAQP